jgi:hypothetical protein
VWYVPTVKLHVCESKGNASSWNAQPTVVTLCDSHLHDPSALTEIDSIPGCFISIKLYTSTSGVHISIGVNTIDDIPPYFLGSHDTRESDQ